METCAEQVAIHKKMRAESQVHAGLKFTGEEPARCHTRTCAPSGLMQSLPMMGGVLCGDWCATAHATKNSCSRREAAAVRVEAVRSRTELLPLA